MQDMALTAAGDPGLVVSGDLSWLTTSLDMGRTSPAALPKASMAEMKGIHRGKRCPQTFHQHVARSVWLTAEGCSRRSRHAGHMPFREPQQSSISLRTCCQLYITIIHSTSL